VLACVGSGGGGGVFGRCGEVLVGPLVCLEGFGGVHVGRQVRLAARQGLVLVGGAHSPTRSTLLHTRCLQAQPRSHAHACSCSTHKHRPHPAPIMGTIPIYRKYHPLTVPSYYPQSQIYHPQQHIIWLLSLPRLVSFCSVADLHLFYSHYLCFNTSRHTWGRNVYNCKFKHCSQRSYILLLLSNRFISSQSL
jgi:hypothetical protein